jgi:hypothetical protein
MKGVTFSSFSKGTFRLRAFTHQGPLAVSLRQGFIGGAISQIADGLIAV